MYRPGPAAKVATAVAAASLLFSSAASASVRASDHVVSASLVSASAQVAAPAESRADIGVLPMLLGLVAVAGLIWLILDDDDDDEISLPVSRG